MTQSFLSTASPFFPLPLVEIEVMSLGMVLLRDIPDLSHFGENNTSSKWFVNGLHLLRLNNC